MFAMNRINTIDNCKRILNWYIRLNSLIQYQHGIVLVPSTQYKICVCTFYSVPDMCVYLLLSTRHVCVPSTLYQTCVCTFYSVPDMCVYLLLCTRHVCVPSTLYQTCVCTFYSVPDMCVYLLLCTRHVCVPSHSFQTRDRLSLED